jgi:ATP/maltotriose-dependent transcriptional regulator MalT/DNA-binding SARP family transcriptional activator
VRSKPKDRAGATAGDNTRIAKVTRPHPGRWVARERLYALLDAARDQPLVWIAAPPGAGKTTLVAGYLETRGPTCLWYQVDAGDADIATFYHYFGLALRRAAPRKRKPLPAFAPGFPEGMDAFARRYFEDALARVAAPALVVLDNFQDAGTDSQLHRVLREAAAVAPPGVRFLVLSRSEPPPMLARARASGTLALIGADQLALTLDETRSLVNARGPAMGELTPLLHQRTKGWAAGIVLLLEQGEASAPAAAQTTAGDATPLLFDYFAEEVFRCTAAEVQEVLLRTAILPRVGARMAEALTGVKGAHAVLERLYRSNYFTVRHDQPETAYQYHPLFREFLLRQGELAYAEPVRRELRGRAAALLEADGQFEESANLLREDGLWQPLERLVLSNAAAMHAQGRGRTLLDWIEAIPADRRARSPWLQYWLGMAKLAFDPKQAREALVLAFAEFRATAEAAGAYLSWATIVESILHEYASLQDMDHWIAVHDEMRAQGVAYPSPAIEARVACNLLTAIALRQQGHPQAEYWVTRAHTLCELHGDASARAIALAARVMLRIWTGNYAAAGVALDEALRQVEREPPPPHNLVSIALMEAIYLGNTAVNAANYEPVERGLRIARQTGVHVWDAELYGQGAVMALNWGDLGRAAEFLARMGQLSHQSRSVHVAGYHLFSAWERFLQEDTAAALAQADVALQRARDAGSRPLEIHSLAMYAEALHAQGHTADAFKVLKHFDQLPSRRAQFRRWLAETDMLLDGGRDAEALACLREGFAIGSEMGYTGFYGWRPGMMSRLCGRALDAGIEPDYARRLVRERRLQPEGASLDSSNWPWPVRIRAIGEFTVEVDGVAVRFKAKAQRKPLDLLKAIVAGGGRAVPDARLAQALWPDAEGDAAQQALATTLHRLRKLLGDEEAIEVESRALSLNPARVWVDALAFERLAASEDPAGRAAAADLYRGTFLGNDEAPWALGTRERLRAKFLRLARDLGEGHERAGDWSGARAAYERALEADNLVEELHCRLMRCHLRLGQRAEALAAYRRCRELLSVVLGLQPAAETQALYREIKEG